MLQVILNNLLYISIAFGVLVLCVVANISASVYYNVARLHERLNFTKFINGVLKMCAIGVTTAILAIVVTLVPYLIELTGVIIPEIANEVFTIGSIILLYFSAIKKYFLEAYNTIKNILENESIISSDDRK